MRFGALFVLAIYFTATLKGVESNCGCPVPFNAVGCFKDVSNPANRALPELILTERDTSSPHWNGNLIDWANWKTYLPAFVCRCAKVAAKRGYEYFGMQFWGECWSGPTPPANSTYNKHGSGEGCYNRDFQPCTSVYVGNDGCIGAAHHNYIYKIVPYKCDVEFERLGCYKDHTRPLPELLLTDRDPSSPATTGINIDWAHYDTYLPDLICRCAKAANAEGYNTFGLQYYGECWSGEHAATEYYREDTSQNCIGTCFSTCKKYEKFCMGMGMTNFVYRVKKEPCEMTHTALGCYTEDKHNRVLDELIFDDLDPQSDKFMGIYAEFQNDWDKYIKGLICRCARKVKELQYNTFAIYKGGQCWSAVNGHNSYDDLGSSNTCYHETVGASCTGGQPCSGHVASIYVYQLA